jgi:hypothetical protein
MREPREIVLRIKQQQQVPMSFEPEVLIPYLAFEDAKPFLNEKATQEEWDKVRQAYTREVVLAEAKRYMADYGWPKCQDHRGISASRTIQKMTAWAWLLSEEALLEKMHSTPYENYGAPILKVVCEHFTWPIPDDQATQRMMQGKPCTDNCEAGCGS